METGEWTNEGQVQVIKQEGNTRAGSEESKMSIQNKTGNVQNQQKTDEQTTRAEGQGTDRDTKHTFFSYLHFICKWTLVFD